MGSWNKTHLTTIHWWSWWNLHHWSLRFREPILNFLKCIVCLTSNEEFFQFFCIEFTLHFEFVDLIIDHSSLCKVKVSRFEEYIFRDVYSFKLDKVDEMAEFCSCTPYWSMKIFAWDRSMIFRETSESVKVILESINWRGKRHDLLYWGNQWRRNFLPFRLSNYFFNLVNIAFIGCSVKF